MYCTVQHEELYCTYSGLQSIEYLSVRRSFYEKFYIRRSLFPVERDGQTGEIKDRYTRYRIEFQQPKRMGGCATRALLANQTTPHYHRTSIPTAHGGCTVQYCTVSRTWGVVNNKIHKCQITYVSSLPRAGRYDMSASLAPTHLDWRLAPPIVSTHCPVHFQPTLE